MAVHTNHPVSAPPQAPRRETTGHLLLRGWCIVVIVAALVGGTWLPLTGTVGADLVAIGSGAVSLVLWAVLRPPVQWRLLPWLALLYVAWAVASLIWSAYREVTALTVLLLVATTLQALFVAAVLTWNEVVRALASALKWVLALSMLAEVLPIADRGHFFDGLPIHGIFAETVELATVAILGMVVFGVRFAARAPRRVLLVGWFLLAAALLVRAGSIIGWITAAGVVVVLATVLVMRTTRRPGERTRYYLVYAAVAVGGLGWLWLARDAVFAWLGRSSDLVGREGVWELVWAQASAGPVVGWGFASPWIATDPFFDGWITDQGETATQAHSIWLDVYFQLGIIGLVLFAGAVLAFVWRAWFFAVDRPRWDLVADRPYSPTTLVPTLTAAIILVQGLVESGPLVGWGWMLIVLFGFKTSQAPLIGRGPSEERLIGEQGESTR